MLSNKTEVERELASVWFPKQWLRTLDLGCQGAHRGTIAQCDSCWKHWPLNIVERDRKWKGYIFQDEDDQWSKVSTTRMMFLSLWTSSLSWFYKYTTRERESLRERESRERQRERERESVCVCERERESRESREKVRESREKVERVQVRRVCVFLPLFVF